MLEAEIQKQITSYLTLRKVLWFRVPVGGMRVGGGRRVKSPLKGCPDLLAVLGGVGRLMAIECKVPKGGKWYPEQLEWRARLEAAGVIYIVGDSLEAVSERLNAYERFGT